MKNRKKVNHPFWIAGILLCFVVFALFFSSGMLARYTTGAGAPDDARVAKFSNKIELVDGEASVALPDPVATTDPFTFTVENDSEVAVRYTLELVFPAGKPDYLTVKYDGEAQTPDAAGKITVPCGELAVGAPAETNSKLTFEIDAALFTADQEAPATGEIAIEDVEIDFDAYVKFVQID